MMAQPEPIGTPRASISYSLEDADCISTEQEHPGQQVAMKDASGILQ